MHLSLSSRVRSGVGNIAGNDGFDFLSHHIYQFKARTYRGIKAFSFKLLKATGHSPRSFFVVHQC